MEMGPGRVERVGPRLTKLCGQYYIGLVFFANREGASATYDEAKEVRRCLFLPRKGRVSRNSLEELRRYGCVGLLSLTWWQWFLRLMIDAAYWNWYLLLNV
ncbi:hypothetical protein ACFX2H_023060 [Malus domestica]